MRKRAPVPTPDPTQERDAAAIAIEQAFGQLNAVGAQSRSGTMQ